MKLRIHGDNIIECERALKLLANAFNLVVVDKTENIFMPRYSLRREGEEIYEIELLGGHGRWNVNFNSELIKYGAHLREATDAYISKVSNDQKTEELLIAMEFCSALPAGNNAWQRSGRAITCAEIGIPYFYIAEIGGVELDSERGVIASRFPNPIVPFSYLTASKSLSVICVPIYQAHPAITPYLRTKFNSVFGLESCLDLLKCLIEGNDVTSSLKALTEKGAELVRILANDRSRVDTFRNSEWDEFLGIESGQQKAEWIKNNPNKQIWKKKSGGKVQVTASFKTLLIEVQKLNCLSIGAKEIPICLITKDHIKNFVAVLKSIYSYDSIEELVVSIIEKNKPLIIVWITGFKPKGDDSRPDRGLIPMTRMLFGNDIDILTIVSGPAGKNTWKVLKDDPRKLAHANGLWEAIINLSNYVLADSITAKEGVVATLIQRNIKREKRKVIFDAAKPNGIFSEHDVDTAIHTLFSRQLNYKVFESMCNPPGGDWSGISYWDFTNETEYRWTSLPRVSSIQAKRPDHIIHINTPSDEIFLVIESKNHSRDLESNIGSRLVEYVVALFKVAPTAHKLKNKDWKLFEEIASPLKQIVTLSGGAFCFTNFNDLEQARNKGHLDFIFAFEFKKDGSPSIGHLLVTEKSQFLVDLITNIVSQFNGRFEIKIY